MSDPGFDRDCMAEAFRLARKGLFTTDPNPRVGCVIAHGGRIVGAGWHRAAGGPHAEVEALAQAGEHARGGTAYVTLEPCSHHGRTPPCTEALLEAGIARVVAAGTDPDPRVDGLALLRDRGVVCETGLMEDEAESLNPGFLQRMRLGRPWIRVKLATSLDGRTALRNGESQWITGETARADVQQWRARSSAILTGVETVLADDPSLDLRLEGAQRQPLRVVCDSHWRTPPAARTLGLLGQVLIAGLATVEPPAALRAGPGDLLPLPAGPDGRLDLHALMATLADRGVNELQVEAGATLCGALLDARLVDELLLYQAPCVLGDQARPVFRIEPPASMAGRLMFERLDSGLLGEDLRMRFRPVYATGVSA